MLNSTGNVASCSCSRSVLAFLVSTQGKGGVCLRDSSASVHSCAVVSQRQLFSCVTDSVKYGTEALYIRLLTSPLSCVLMVSCGIGHNGSYSTGAAMACTMAVFQVSPAGSHVVPGRKSSCSQFQTILPVCHWSCAYTSLYTAVPLSCT